MNTNTNLAVQPQASQVRNEMKDDILSIVQKGLTADERKNLDRCDLKQDIKRKQTKLKELQALVKLESKINKLEKQLQSLQSSNTYSY